MVTRTSGWSTGVTGRRVPFAAEEAVTSDLDRYLQRLVAAAHEEPGDETKCGRPAQSLGRWDEPVAQTANGLDDLGVVGVVA